MIRRAVSALLGIGIAAASANSPEPSQQTLHFVATGCTAAGAFGYRFGEHHTRPHETGAAPFVIETLSESRDGLFEIVAAASFAQAPMSGEDRIHLAAWVLRRLDGEITAAHRFARRQERRDGIAYIDAGFVLDLSQDGPILRFSCTDAARKRAAREELRSRP